ncbi:hypothetical protein, conserved [Eimeria necatrix]|uniref:Uncharacterized protein n=1 Tax=Eimeria necatrix TaxID=51315 RepID=U6MM39_9EIME|nr:hypothetical protein, conserved [Eimeria necatrix]CDJ65317.1 hypothetical protein, conserved [Eimeria necatrix]
MASLAQRLSFWIFGGESPPQVPHPEYIDPIILEARFMLNLKMPLKEDTTREEIIAMVNNAVTDRELQAHGLMAMKEKLGLEFDRKLNPNMPEPRYWQPKDTFKSN